MVKTISSTNLLLSTRFSANAISFRLLCCRLISGVTSPTVLFLHIIFGLMFFYRLIRLNFDVGFLKVEVQLPSQLANVKTHRSQILLDTGFRDCVERSTVQGHVTKRL